MFGAAIAGLLFAIGLGLGLWFLWGLLKRSNKGGEVLPAVGSVQFTLPPGLQRLKDDLDARAREVQKEIQEFVSRLSQGHVQMPDDPLVEIVAFGQRVREFLVELAKDAPTNDEVRAAMKLMEDAVIAALSCIVKLSSVVKAPKQ